MPAVVDTAALIGIEAHTVKLEVDLVRSGFPAFTLVGLAEGAAKESKERVFAALKNIGFRLPPARITVNLAPADMRKGGSSFDLPLALAMLAAAGTLPEDALKGWYVAGELSLTGELKPVSGILPMAVKARAEETRGVIVPAGNAAEASVVRDTNVYGVSTLKQAIDFLNREIDLEPCKCDIDALWEKRETFHLDFSEVKGQDHAKRAIEIAAAGGHNILLMGPPGSGKTMLAQRIPTILPSLSFDEALEVTKIYSVAGRLGGKRSLIVTRPFRSPHHTISDAGLIGGGHVPKPGEVSLTHRGVLFLDELPEFKKHVLEVLRQPLEDGRVTISRAAVSISYPASFMLVAAMNPCPCGYLGDAAHKCSCSAEQIRRYRTRISGPLMDRIDLHVEVPAVPYKDLKRTRGSEDSVKIRERVNKAREIQNSRYRGLPLLTNSELSGMHLEKYCRLSEDCHGFLERAVKRLGLSARAYTRVLRIARTVADLEETEDLSVEHLAEAVNYRTLDRKEE